MISKPVSRRRSLVFWLRRRSCIGLKRNLRQSFKRETEMLFESIVREDRSIVNLLDADYTFVDERLAQHYGIPNIHGTYFRRITLNDSSPRRGILGQGSFLTISSVGTRT